MSSALAGFQIGQGLGGAIGQGLLGGAQVRDLDSLIKYRDKQIEFQEQQLKLDAEKRATFEKLIFGQQQQQPQGAQPGEAMTGGVSLAMLPPAARERVLQRGRVAEQVKLGAAQQVQDAVARLSEAGREDEVLSVLASSGIRQPADLLALPEQRLAVLGRALQDMVRETAQAGAGSSATLGGVSMGALNALSQMDPGALLDQARANQRQLAPFDSMLRGLMGGGILPQINPFEPNAGALQSLIEQQETQLAARAAADEERRRGVLAGRMRSR